jgi:hypothetical protein
MAVSGRDMEYVSAGRETVVGCKPVAVGTDPIVVEAFEAMAEAHPLAPAHHWCSVGYFNPMMASRDHQLGLGTVQSLVQEDLFDDWPWR